MDAMNDEGTAAAAKDATVSMETFGIGDTPSGHRYLQRRIHLASGRSGDTRSADRAFERGRALLRAWGPQVGAGIRVEGGENPPQPGNTAVLRMRVGGVLPVRAPIRVYWTVDERDHAGFAYETLPGHPESGRESFIVTRERDATDRDTTGKDATGREDVWFTVTAFSRPAAWYARLGGPVTRIVQNR